MSLLSSQPLTFLSFRDQASGAGTLNACGVCECQRPQPEH